MDRSKLLLGLVLSVSIAGVGVAGSEGEAGNEAGEKKPLQWHSGDGVLTLGGKSATEYRFAKNATLLNRDLPDEVGHFRQTVDTDLNYAYGEKKFGHKAVELAASMRFKTIWGKVGDKWTSTEDNSDFKVGNAAVSSSHNHKNRRPYLWFKEAWLKASLNAIAGSDNEKLHTVTAGFFPFYVGRGIAFGPFYGVGRSYLGFFSRETDYSAPGFLLSGELVKDALWYDVYYSKLEEKSESFSDVFNSNMEKIVGRESTPWTGVGKDSDLFVARLKIKPLDNESAGTLELEPYVMYNEDSNQKVEEAFDSKTILGAVGAGLEYKNKNFEFGGEVAANYGHENLFHLDRNKVILSNTVYPTEHATTTDQRPGLREVYSHVLYNGGADDGLNVVVESTATTAITNNTNTTNGGVLSSSANYKNATDRYRPAYKNKFKGWMAVVDTSYLFDCIDLKVAAAYGYASGDKNPHIDEVDKNFDGFVGLYELYAGKRVPSIFLLDAKKVKRPLIANDASGTNVVLREEDTMFTDLHHVGIGLSWEPSCLKKHNFKLNPNLLFFWKDYTSKKFDREQAQASTEDASKFLGTEFNLIAQYDLLKDLSLKGAFSVFFPGSYYKDIKGTPMSDSDFAKLEELDKESLDSIKYKMGDDTAFYVELKLEYKF